MDPICVSGPVMLLLTPVVTGIVAGFGLLYRDAVKSRESQITYLTVELSEAHKRLQIATPLMEEAETEVRRVRGRRGSV